MSLPLASLTRLGEPSQGEVLRRLEAFESLSKGKLSKSLEAFQSFSKGKPLEAFSSLAKPPEGFRSLTRLGKPSKGEAYDAGQTLNNLWSLTRL